MSGNLFQNLTIFGFFSLVHPVLDLLFACLAVNNTADIGGFEGAGIMPKAEGRT